METKIAPMYTTLTLAYLVENLYKIIGEIQQLYKNNLLDYGKDT